MKQTSLKILLSLVVALALFVWVGQGRRFPKHQLPTTSVFTDTAQTFTTSQTFNNPIKFGASSTPANNGEIGYDGTYLKYGVSSNAA